MISLKSPITITPSPVNGKAIAPIVLNQIDWIVSYDNKSATAFIKGANVYLTLWNAKTTPTYAQAGQFTDADVDSRVAELLGKDIAASITELYPNNSSLESKPKNKSFPKSASIPFVKTPAIKKS